MSIVSEVKVTDAVFTPSYIPAVYDNQTLFEGAVLKTGWKTYQVMSDEWRDGQYALVWNFVTGKSETVNWIVSGFVDATDAVKVLYRKEQVDRKAEYVYNDRVAKEEARVNAIVKGDIVRVVRGRQAKGLVGPVVVETWKPYAQGWKSVTERKFAIAKDDVMVDVVAANGKTYRNYANVEWVWARNCEKAIIPPVNTINKDDVWAEVAKDWDYQNQKEYA